MIESCVCGRKRVAYLDGSSGIITSYKDEYAVGQDNVIGLNNPKNPEPSLCFCGFLLFFYFFPEILDFRTQLVVPEISITR